MYVYVIIIMYYYASNRVLSVSLICRPPFLASNLSFDMDVYIFHALNVSEIQNHLAHP